MAAALGIQNKAWDDRKRARVTKDGCGRCQCSAHHANGIGEDQLTKKAGGVGGRQQAPFNLFFLFFLLFVSSCSWL